MTASHAPSPAARCLRQKTIWTDAVRRLKKARGEYDSSNAALTKKAATIKRFLGNNERLLERQSSKTDSDNEIGTAGRRPERARRGHRPSRLRGFRRHESPDGGSRRLEWRLHSRWKDHAHKSGSRMGILGRETQVTPPPLTDSTCNRQTCNRPTHNRHTCNRPTCNRPTCNRPTGNRPICNRPTDNKPTCNRPTCNRPSPKTHLLADATRRIHS